MKDIYGFEHTTPRDAYGFQKQAAVTDDEISAVPILPFGSSYMGYQRGKMTGNGGEGLLRGFAGGTAGGLMGGALGGIAGPAGSIAGGMAGNLLGTHYATRSMLPSVQAAQARPSILNQALAGQQGQTPVVDPKDLAAHMTPEQQAQMEEGIRTGHGGIDNRPKVATLVGPHTKQALAPGLLGRMGTALGGMGTAVRNAGGMAAKDYKLLNSVGTGARTFGHELAGSQDGRRALGAMAGVAGAGMLGAGAAGYNAMRGSSQPQQPKVANLMGRMGKVLNVAGQRAKNMYGVEREMFGSGVGNALVQGARTGVGSMMNSQTGRGMLGAGAGLAGAGVLGAGAAGYNAMRGGQPQQPKVAGLMGRMVEGAEKVAAPSWLKQLSRSEPGSPMEALIKQKMNVPD